MRTCGADTGDVLARRQPGPRRRPASISVLARPRPSPIGVHEDGAAAAPALGQHPAGGQPASLIDGPAPYRQTRPRFPARAGIGPVLLARHAPRRMIPRPCGDSRRRPCSQTGPRRRGRGQRQSPCEHGPAPRIGPHVRMMQHPAGGRPRRIQEWTMRRHPARPHVRARRRRRIERARPRRPRPRPVSARTSPVFAWPAPM